MTNNKPIFYFGTTILILLLFATTASTTQNHFLDDRILTFIFAQDDDEKEEKEEEEEPEESKDEEEEEKEEPEESGSEEPASAPEPEPTVEEPTNTSVVTNETIQETAQQIVEAELSKMGITTNESQTPPQEETIPSPPPQPVANEMQFDATCNCTTAKLPSKPPVMQPITPPPSQPIIQQIPISTSNILGQISLGKVIDPIYTSYYTVANLFDSKVDDTSFWSQAGNSGFSIQLDQTLNDYRVCSIEFDNIPNPKNVPFILDVGTSKNYTGVLNQANQRIQFDSCISNMNQIVMIFNKGNPQSEDFISIGEIKLFGSKLAEVQPPLQQQLLPSSSPPPQQQPYKNAAKVNISNADAQIDIKNSTITFKFDPSSAQATGYSVITIPDTNVIK